MIIRKQKNNKVSDVPKSDEAPILPWSLDLDYETKIELYGAALAYAIMHKDYALMITVAKELVEFNSRKIVERSLEAGK